MRIIAGTVAILAMTTLANGVAIILMGLRIERVSANVGAGR